MAYLLFYMIRHSNTCNAFDTTVGLFTNRQICIQNETFLEITTTLLGIRFYVENVKKFSDILNHEICHFIE